MFDSIVAGFSLGFSLIVAIGSQNAFVLKQALYKQNVFVVCLVCAISDALLIAIGISSFGAIVANYPSVSELARYGGALFLLIYSLLNFKSAFFSNSSLVIADKPKQSLFQAIALCLAFTWLNPHVYLDTIVLLGSISSQFQPLQWYFGIGAMSASFIFFFSLGYCSRLLIPFFSKPKSWRILDFVIGLTMLIIAIMLLLA